MHEVNLKYISSEIFIFHSLLLPNHAQAISSIKIRHPSWRLFCDPSILAGHGYLHPCTLNRANFVAAYINPHPIKLKYLSYGWRKRRKERSLKEQHIISK